jgi:hypothetical protein
VPDWATIASQPLTQDRPHDGTNKTTVARSVTTLAVVPGNNSAFEGLTQDGLEIMTANNGGPLNGQSKNISRDLANNQSNAIIIGSVGLVLLFLSMAGLAAIAVYLRSHSIKKQEIDHLRPQDRPDTSRPVVPDFFSFTETLTVDTRPYIGYGAANELKSFNMPVTTIHCRMDCEQAVESSCSSMASSRAFSDQLARGVDMDRDIIWYPKITDMVHQSEIGDVEEASQPQLTHPDMEVVDKAEIDSESLAMVDCLVDHDDMSSQCLSASRAFSFPSLKSENQWEQASTWSADIILMCRNMFSDREDQEEKMVTDNLRATADRM